MLTHTDIHIYIYPHAHKYTRVHKTTHAHKYAHTETSTDISDLSFQASDAGSESPFPTNLAKNRKYIVFLLLIIKLCELDCADHTEVVLCWMFQEITDNIR